MPPGKQSKSDAGLADLARCLRQERLYVTYERKQLQQLNEAVAASGRRLAQTSWAQESQGHPAKIVSIVRKLRRI